MAFPKLLSKLFTNSGAGSKLNPGLASSLPIGAITAFSGNFDSTGHPISSGAADTSWRLCDGGDGTPDLRGRFILGVSAGHPAGQTGGEEEHTLSWNEMPPHNHGLQEHISASEASPFCLSSGSGAFYDRIVVGNPNPGQRFTDSAGAGRAHNNMPPYYALSFIMKIA